MLLSMPEDFNMNSEYIEEKTNGQLIYRQCIYCDKCKKPTKHFFLKTLNREICSICYLREKEKELEKRVSKETFQNDNKRAVSMNKGYLRRNSIIANDNYLEKNFDSFKTKNKSKLNNVKEPLRQLTRQILDGETFNVFLYSSESGTGKTHLGFSMLNAINENCFEWKDNNRQLKCLAVSFLTLADKISQSITEGENKQAYYLELIKNADVLLLDDIGAEKTSEFRTSLLFDILENRAETKTTIFTTNLDDKELLNKYGKRVFSRMSVNKKVVDFSGLDDYRMNKI